MPQQHGLRIPAARKAGLTQGNGAELGRRRRSGSAVAEEHIGVDRGIAEKFGKPRGLKVVLRPEPIPGVALGG